MKRTNSNDIARTSPLRLTREAIRPLDRADLVAVVGAVKKLDFTTICVPSYPAFCPF